MNTDKPLLAQREAERLLTAACFLALKALLHLVAVVVVIFITADHFDGYPLSFLLFGSCVCLLACCAFVLNVDWKRGF